MQVCQAGWSVIVLIAVVRDELWTAPRISFVGKVYCFKSFWLSVSRLWPDMHFWPLQAKGRRIPKELACEFPHPAFVNEVLVTAKIPYEFEVS